MMSYAGTKHQFVICVNNEGYPVSLQCWRVYRALPDRDADAHDMLRVVDESGQDYLYAKTRFRPLEIPSNIVRLLRRKSAA